MTQVSRTVGQGRVIDELVVSFTHDVEMPALLPGIESGRLALGSGIRVEGNQVVMEAERGGIAVWVW